jgi:hypothetical protein
MVVSAEEELERVLPDDLSSEIESGSLKDDNSSSSSYAVESSEFALRLVNGVKSMNLEEITHYDLVNSFSLVDEKKCLFLFIKALPYDPIVAMYPEHPFLFFKGVPVPRSFNLTEDFVSDIETYMKGNNSDDLDDLHLHDLEPYYLDAYESAVRIYNDIAEKTRNSYLANVKQAKSQVIEVSAAMVCGFIVLLALVGLS